MIAAESVTVANAVEGFRSGLMALTPSAELAGIPWRNEEAYDEWDRIAESLFDVFIGAPIRLDANARPDALPLLHYDFGRQDLLAASWLELDVADERESLALLSFLSGDRPFEICDLARVNVVTGVVDEWISEVNLSSKFRLRRRYPGGTSEIVRILEPLW
jgi:hypothetical protein